MKSAAEPVGFAVFLGFVMLLAILVEAMVAGGRSAELVEVIPALRRALRFLAPAMSPVQSVDEFALCFVAVLAFGVILRTFLVALFVVHVDLVV